MWPISAALFKENMNWEDLFAVFAADTAGSLDEGDSLTIANPAARANQVLLQ